MLQERVQNKVRYDAMTAAGKSSDKRKHNPIVASASSSKRKSADSNALVLARMLLVTILALVVPAASKEGKWCMGKCGLWKPLSNFATKVVKGWKDLLEDTLEEEKRYHMGTCRTCAREQ
jgi:hypothetical protein